MKRYILSISFCVHDTCVTIADQKRILLHLEGERFFKKKHIGIKTAEEMDKLVAGALEHLGLNINQISEVLITNFWNRYTSPVAKILGRSFTPIMTRHHDNHIGATFPSKFKDAVIVCADGGSHEGMNSDGTMTPTITTRIYHKQGKHIKLLEDLDATPMTGRFYGTAAQMVIHPDPRLAHETHVGKLMGLSSMGQYDSELWDSIRQNEDLLNVYYGDGCQKMNDLFNLNHDYKKPWENERIRNFSYCVHNYWVDRFYEYLKKFAHISSNIALTGGCALNISLNSKIIETGLFKNVYVSPISSDCGQSLGAILFKYPNIKCEYPYLGRGFGPEILKKDVDVDQLVKDLMAGNIVAWYQGRSEIGPRALGHRSFIGLPHSIEMRDKLSIQVKRREPYRPVACIILEEDKNKFFEGKGDFRYMTFIAKAKEITKKLAPAIVHYDGTTRLQTLDKKDNPVLYKCLKKLKKLTGVPIIMNSSFNVAGYPIVDTPEDAMINFNESECEVLYLNGQRIVNPQIVAK